ncbi:protein fuzzy homolog [Plakobranchus ocellatus]|uniref:Protein fuzzy homolog n=1 Tax=Plakobranchus ocellatus TaxID=259542 RepID=A0AAV3ZW11_9GAST|nr:protein fuzzy homolog [Plakobranchus ocellatus]
MRTREYENMTVCFQLVDFLLQQAASPLFSDLTAAVDVLMVSEASVLQPFIEALAEAAESPYGCLLVGGRIVVATDRWWVLTARELTLLSTLLMSLPECSARDVPVYLPHGSPTVPHRLLTFELLRNVMACVICGPSPPLSELEREIGRFWMPAVETLKSVRKTLPRNIPHSIEVDANILGFILINTSTHRCLNSVSLIGASGRGQGEEQACQEKRRAVLRSFYTMVVGSYFNRGGEKSGESSGPSELSHQPTDTYIVCSGHKCYAHTSGKYQIFVLFAAKTPTFAMRSVTHKTLNLVVKDKSSPL